MPLTTIGTDGIDNNAITTAKIADDAVDADKLANSINTEVTANTAKTGITSGQASAITANTAKVTNATHTGDVTGATALTIAVDAVDIAMLSATGTASATTFLRGDNAWAAAGLSGWSENGADNDLLPASASAGIYLGVNSATAANLLDDYETGTWTCTFTNANSQTGYYVKIGNLVHVSAKISTSGGASGTSFGGLPFTTASSDDYRSSGGVGYQNSTSGVWNPLTNSSNTTFGFFIADASQEMGSTGKTTYFSITYPTS